MQAGSGGLAHKSDYEGGRGTAGETCEVKGKFLLRGKCWLRVRNRHRGAKRGRVGRGPRHCSEGKEGADGSLHDRKLKPTHLRAAGIEEVEVAKEIQVGLEDRSTRSCQIKEKAGDPAQGGRQRNLSPAMLSRV